MNDPALLTRASTAYLQAGAVEAAARCLAQAGNHAGAAGWYLHERRYVEAARQFYLAGQNETAAWVHVHHLGEPEVAREIMRELPPLGDDLRQWGARADWYERLCEEILSTYLIDPRITIQQTRPGRANRTGTAGRRSPRTAYSAFLVNILRGSGEAKIAFNGAPETARDLLEYHLRQLRRIQMTVSVRQDPQLHSAMMDFEQRLRARIRVLNEPMPYQRSRLNLLRRLVDIRCTIAEGTVDRNILTVLEETRAALVETSPYGESERLEAWSVAIAELIRRYDRAALIFAASVSGGTPGAAERWREWSTRVLGAVPTLIDQKQVG